PRACAPPDRVHVRLPAGARRQPARARLAPDRRRGRSRRGVATAGGDAPGGHAEPCAQLRAGGAGTRGAAGAPARAWRRGGARGREGVVVRAGEAALVQPPGTLVTGGGDAYQVFGAYARAWEVVDVPAAVRAPHQWAPAATLRGIGGRAPAVPAGFELPPSG